MLETKGGSVQDLLLHDVTKFGTTASLDLIVGDADGHIIIFSHHEILQRSTLAYPITALAVSTDISRLPLPSCLPHAYASRAYD